MVDEDRHLPVIEYALDDEAPACSPTNYVSNEEASLLASMRRLRERAKELRREMGGAEPEDRARLEAELEELPHLQKQVIRDCIAGGLPVITATQMLDSMIIAQAPTRAEATDIANAVFDGTSAVMLSAETAIGHHPALVIETMARIAERSDDQFNHASWAERVAALRMAGHEHSEAAVTDAMTIAAARACEELKVRAVICISGSGFTVRSMARFRPSAKILGFSGSEATVRQLASSWGVTPVLFEGSGSEYEERVRLAVNQAKRERHVVTGDLIGVVAGISSTARATDTFRLLRVS